MPTALATVSAAASLASARSPVRRIYGTSRVSFNRVRPATTAATLTLTLTFLLLLAGCSRRPTAPLTVTVTPKAFVVDVGNTYQLHVLISNGVGRLEWTSSDTAVATVDSTGLLTAVDTGRP